MPGPYRLIILRHGRSEWNEQDLFTGWVDVPLAAGGIAEATRAGTLLARADWRPDLLYTSLLRRAIATAHLALDACDRAWIPVRRAAALNERHYGALQGRNKTEAVAREGAARVHRWRRSFDVRPPETTAGYRATEDGDGRYASQGVAVPATECLRDVLERVLPFWEREIVPDLRTGKVVLVAAHGNSLRALVKQLEGIGDEDIPGVEIPTGIPILYELDENFKGKGRHLG